jgi:signal transduction histidine kinase
MMGDLVESFLDTALIESGHFKLDTGACKLVEVLSVAIAVVDPMARRRAVALRLVCDPQLPLLQLDASKMQQVVINLLNNAVQHSPDGAEVVVSARRQAGEVLLEVRDSGAGIPADLQKELFTAYVHGARTQSPAERSIGLGLAITRMIVLAHGGRVTASSELGAGSTFTVYLPVGQQKP